MIRRATDRFRTRTDWLDSRHSFSYGAHYDPAEVGFGALLAHNEDVVEAGTGFDLHPHADTEIVTWVLSGSLVHADSQGEQGVVYPGLAQRLSAGRGIDHAERNDAYRTDGGFRIDRDRAVEPVHFVQMWVRPDTPGVVPSYQQREIDPAAPDLGWVPIASGSHPDAAITIGSRASTLWVGTVAGGQRRRLPDGARLHVFVARGAVAMETGERLHSGDAVRLLDAGGLWIEGLASSGPAEPAEPAEVLVWELAR